MNNDTAKTVASLRGERVGGNVRTSTPKLGKQESWALNYESGNGLSNDESTIAVLSELEDPTPSQRNQLQQALSRRDHYWKVSSGGQYGSEPQQQEQSQGDNDAVAWYDQEWRNHKAQNPNMSDQQITDYMTYLISQK